jgi:protein-tyrosine phosphatase
MNCNRITQHLLVGSSLLDPKDFEELRSLGVTAILSLQSEEDMGKRGIPGEEAEAVSANLAFRSVPIQDFDNADLQWKLPQCVLALDALLKAGHIVYLHCTAGVSRSPTIAAAYLHRCLAWPLDKAVTHVRKARDCSPNAEVIQSAQWQT